MNYVIWKARGTGARSFPALIRDLKAHYNLNFIAILETRCAKELSIRRAQWLGFSNLEIIDCEGYSGGIWCLWDENNVTVSVLERHHQFIHLQVTTPSRPSWLFSVVYASPSSGVRRLVWDHLARLANEVQGPWLVGGDFNGTLTHGERRSTAAHQISVDHEFLRWFDIHNLIDVGFAGPEFTWKGARAEACLDRILANEQWLNSFPDASVTHLPFFKSDHRPLLVRINTHEVPKKPNRPFRFIAAWALHENFDGLVSRSWKANIPWTQNINQFAVDCSSWNINVFRHTEFRKKRLLRRMDGLNRAISQYGLLARYEELQQSLWKELEDVLLQESLIWAQKARAQWTIYGDRNTRYFHARANQRKKAKRVDAIKDEEGAWVFDTGIIKGLATSFFSKLLTEDRMERPTIQCRITFPSIDEDILNWCSRDVSEQDIKEAICSMGALKSPGPDGFSALFYQNQWNTIRASVVKYVKSLFANPQAIREVNDTFIVLIPKKDHPETMGDMRPISLCNVIYKVVTKILVARMKTILPQVIAPNQCSFVPG
ncbi:hypothetical protein QN277_006188 [Acacia crassicarpa]|uniref:Endonuclease/exonuclease/phosphatase domain-containing protein n=1 Tax=Acacia crassicarpa TaxID=499986 RepID=A0AAE1MC16_9FABA|nr:hypothetical protein QN277_006188 [Acacia crassicarpa]